MKPATVSVLKEELNHQSQKNLVELCLHLAKFKKENKELLSYLLFDSLDENQYISDIKYEIDEGFSEINLDSLYYIKKSTRKILRSIKKYIRFAKKKEIEVELLLYFCHKLKHLNRSYRQSQQMINMYEKQLEMAMKALNTLHEDLQYDYRGKIEELQIK